jgi:dTDP-4-amino-4,6-dideoxygalactose transaminase
MKIPFLDLKEVNRPYGQVLTNAFLKKIESGRFILSDEVTAFETNFANYCGVEFCIGVASGLDALTLILKAYDFTPGSEVLVAANTYIATILAITNAGLKPILIEPDPETYLISTELLEKHITSDTKAILLTHLYGKCCDMGPAYQLAERYNLKLFEDAAQAHGATYQNRKAGNLSHAAGFSFYPSKNLGALGDGGAVTTNDKIIAERIRVLRNYGSGKKYVFEKQGMNSRLDEIQAAFLNVKLKNLDKENAFRRMLAKLYLSGITQPDICLPSQKTADLDAWHLFVIRHPNRDLLKNYLDSNGIGTDIHYPIPPHRQHAFPEWNALSFPVTEKIHREVLSLPLNTALSVQEVEYIIQTINRF